MINLYNIIYMQKLLNFLFIFIIIFSCQKKVISKPKPLETESRAIKPLENYLSTNRLGLGNLNDKILLNVDKLGQDINLEEDTPYNFKIYFNKNLIYNEVLENVMGIFWDIPNTSSTTHLSFLIDATNLKDGAYPLELQIQYKNQIVYKDQMNFNIERYVLRNQADLEGIQHFDLAGNYSLGNDITMTKSFTPIALCAFQVSTSPISINNGHVVDVTYHDCTPFSGTLNGKNYTIKNLKIIHLSTFSGVGLFGVIDGKNAQIKNLKVEVEKIKGGNLVGTLAGFMRTDQPLLNIEINGHPQVLYYEDNIVGDYSYVGGAVGLMQSFSGNTALNIAENVKVNLNVKGDVMTGGIFGALIGSAMQLHFAAKIPVGQARVFYKISGFQHLGGLIGYLYQGTLLKSSSGADLEGKATSKFIGGLVGTLEGNAAKIEDAYHAHAFVNISNPALMHDLGIHESYRKISGYQFVGGLVGQMKKTSQHALKRVYVDSKNISGSEGSTFLFCQNAAEKSYVFNSFYSFEMNIDEDLGFLPNDRVWMINKKTASQKEYENLGFSFAFVWNYYPSSFPILK